MAGSNSPPSRRSSRRRIHRGGPSSRESEPQSLPSGDRKPPGEPPRQRFAATQPMLDLPVAAKLELEMEAVLLPNKEVAYYHTDLPGRRFNKEKLEFVIGIVSGETRAPDDESKPDCELYLSTLAARYISSSSELGQALNDGDYRTAMRTALRELDIAKRAIDLDSGQIYPSIDRAKLREHAVNDITLAYGMAQAYYSRDEPENDNALTGLRNQLFKREVSENAGSTVFDVAKGFVPSWQWIVGQVSALTEAGKPISEAIAQAMNAYNMCKEIIDASEFIKGDKPHSRSSYRARRMGQLRSIMFELDAAAAVANELHALDVHTRRLMESPVSLDKEAAEEQGVKNLETALTRLDKYRATVEDGKEPRWKEGMPLWVKRMYDICKHNRKSELEVALEVLWEEQTEQKEVPKPPLKPPGRVIIPERFLGEEDEELERHLPKDAKDAKEKKRNDMIGWISGALSRLAKMEEFPYVRDEYVKGIVAYLRVDYSPESVVEYAAAIADDSLRGQKPRKSTLVTGGLAQPTADVAEPPPSGAQATAQRQVEPLSASQILSALEPLEKELVAAALDVMGPGMLDENQLSTFMDMPNPVLRDLKMRNHISSLWEEMDFRDINKYRAALQSLYRKCGLPAPTGAEKLSAMNSMNPSHLSNLQQDMIAYLFGIDPIDLNITHMYTFGVWLRGDPEELESRWNDAILNPIMVRMLAQRVRGNNLDGTFTPESEEKEILALILNRDPRRLSAEDWKNVAAVEDFAARLEVDRGFWRQDTDNYSRLNGFYSTWFESSEEQRLNWWRAGSADVFNLADLAHRMRFVQDYWTNEDALLFELVYEKAFSELTDVEVLNLKDAFIDKLKKDESGRQVTETQVDSAGNPVYDEDGRLKRCFVSRPELRALYKNCENRPNNLMSARRLKTVARKSDEYETLVEFFGGTTRAVSAEGDTIHGKTMPKFLEAKYTQPVQKVVDGKTVEVEKVKKIVTSSYNPINEDCFTGVVITLPDGREMRMHAVFDGAGGHASGDVASQLAKEVLEINAFAGWIRTPEDARRAVLMADLAIALDQMSRKTNQEDDLMEIPMFTTATVTIQIGAELFAIHAGDSEYKVLRGDKVELECKVHDMVYDLEATLAQYPDIPKERADEILEDARQKNRRNEVASILGGTVPYVDIRSFTLKNGDLVLVASDGITDLISNEEIIHITETYKGDLAGAREALISLAEVRKSKSRHLQVDTSQEGNPTDIGLGYTINFEGKESDAVLLSIDGREAPRIIPMITIAPHESQDFDLMSRYGPFRLRLANMGDSVEGGITIDHRSIMDISQKASIKNDDKTIILVRVEGLPE